MLVVASSVDLVIACDTSRDHAERRAAWERYEIECWYRAYVDKGLLIKHMDADRVCIDGEIMQTLVMRRIILGLPK